MMKMLGRKPRRYDPRIPHMSALVKLAKTIALPAQVDYATSLGASGWGAMLNDQLGDCTCAALGHALQTWSSQTNPDKLTITEPDNDVLLMYEGSCGYDPSDPSTDQGGDEQTVLTYYMNTGFPTGPDGATRHLLRAFVEIDPRNMGDIQRTIYECGLTYIGFNVPQAIMPPDGDVPAIWDVGGDSTIIGGHAIIITGYESDGNLDLISWGSKYQMTKAFWDAYVEEAYALADIDWIEGTGLSPLGMSIKDLEAQMQALKK